MLLTSIKGRLSLLLFFVIMIGFLVCLMIFLNHNLQDQGHRVAQFDTTHSLISVLHGKEAEVIGSKDKLPLLISDYQSLEYSCNECHNSRNQILKARIALLEERHSIALQASPLRNRINQQLKGMVNSVRYIHEHHAAILKNNLRDGNLQREVSFSRGQFRKDPMQSAAEIDLIEQAVAIQHSLTELYTSFFLLYSPHDVELLKKKFRKELTIFYNAVNTYENYSIDSQDGLLCEELLEGGRFFENSLEQLLRLETHAKLVLSLLDKNKTTFEVIFADASGKTRRALEKSQSYMHFTYILSGVFAIFIVLASLLNFKKILGSITFIRRETGKIEKESSYRIKVGDKVMEEERQMAAALNNMAASIDSKIAQIESAKHEWEKTFDAIPDCIMLLDCDYKIRRLNRTMADTLGGSPERAIGMTCYQIMHKSDTPHESCPHQKLLQDNKFHETEVYDAVPDRYLSVSTSPLFNEAGQLTGSVHVARNITREKKLKAELKQYVGYLDSVLRSADSTIVVATDTENRIKLYNRAAADFFAIPANMVVEKEIGDLHEGLLPDEFTYLENAEQQNTLSFEKCINSKWIEAHLSFVLDQEGNYMGILLVGRDITDCKRKENEKQMLEQRVVHAEKMELVGRMAKSVAHELNNTLTGVVSHSAMLLHQLPKESELYNPLQSILDSGKRSAAIISDLSALTREIVKVLENICLNEVLKNYFDSEQHQQLIAEYPNVNIVIEMATDLENCSCSPVDIQKVVYNLMSNAMMAIGDEGSIHVSTANLDTEDSSYISGLKEGHYVALPVTDDGPGIDQLDREHIFDPFYSGNDLSRSEFAGLGLAVSRQCVEEHGGIMKVECDVQGSCFTLYLPGISPAGKQ